MNDKRVMTTVPVPTAHILRLVPEAGLGPLPGLAPTAEQMSAMGWVHRGDMYDRLNKLFAECGLDLEGGLGGQLRHFIECIYWYSDLDVPKVTDGLWDALLAALKDTEDAS